MKIGEREILPLFSGIGRKQYKAWSRALRDIPEGELPQFWEEFKKVTSEKKYWHFRGEMLREIEARLINSLPLECKMEWQRVKAEKGKITFEDIFSFWQQFQRGDQ